MYADENVIKIKHAVLLEVAKAAFAGNLDEIRDDIPFTLIPGPTPQFRCCIYKYVRSGRCNQKIGNQTLSDPS